MLLPAWREYVVARMFKVSPLEVRDWPEDRLALYLAFDRGEQQGREDKQPQNPPRG